MSSRDIFELGEKYSVTTTIANDFIPIDDAEHCHHEALVWGVRARHPEKPNWHIDTSSGYGPNILGYSHPGLNRAIISAYTSRMVHFPTTDWHNEWSVRLKEKLATMVPINGENPIVYLSNSGTEAVECAIKLCQARRLREGRLKERSLFITFQGGFHGRTRGSLEVHGSKPHHRKGFVHDDRTFYMPFPEEGDQASIDEYGRTMEYIPREIADHTNACILELVQGEGGIRPIDYDSLQKLVTFCRQNNIYLIIDEVQTGLMRTGTMFACDQYYVRPDIMCLGKALGGGFPLGAVVTSRAFDFEAGQHGSTHGGMKMACEVSCAVIDELMHWAPPVGDRYPLLQQKIEILKQFAPKGKGLFRRLDFKDAEKRNGFVEAALNEKVIVIPAGTHSVRLMPPITISMTCLNQAIQKLTKAREKNRGINLSK